MQISRCSCKLNFNSYLKWALFLATILSPSIGQSLPIDWSGSFGVNTTLIDTYRRTTDIHAPTTTGSQFIEPSAGNHQNASFQNYVFNLKPSIIVNDNVSLYGELTTGYGKGGFLGDSSTSRKEGTPKSFGNSHYLHNTSNGDPNLSLTQLYMELFTDAATFIFGRQPFHWGLGGIWNKGDDLWDRYRTIQDGITAKLKISNFHFSPYYAKINSIGSLTKASNTKAFGFTILYDNVQQDMTFGLLFGRRKSGSQNTFYSSGITNSALGRTKIKTTDFFFQKTFGKFSFGAEVPLFSGDLGNVYHPEQNSKYKAKAFLFETNYTASDTFKVGLNFGHVSGDNGQGPSFNALHLNPNYQIANLLFRYNLHAVKDTTQNIYDSSIVNAKYIKLYSEYKADPWLWSGAVIYAKANEVAKIGTMAYNHNKNGTFNSTTNQDDELGWEIDLGVKYYWNPNVTLNGDFGYHFVGDYYAYTNNTPLKLHNSYLFLAGVGLKF